MLKVYVAASSREIERAERVSAALRELGIVVPHDWPAFMRSHGTNDAALSDDVLLPALLADLEDGIFGADVVLFLAPAAPTTGMWVELGAAWSHALRIVTAGSVAAHPWLRALVPAEDRHETDDAAIACVAQLAREAA